MVAEAVATPDIPVPPQLPNIRTVEVDGLVQVRDIAKRELDIRIMPWGQTIQTAFGTESFNRGAFAGTDPGQVRLMGLEHEVHMGLGQSGEPRMTRHPVGKGITLDDREDGAYMTFRVAQTARGDEVLALAAEDIASGASIEFAEVPQGSTVSARSGRRETVHNLVRLTGVSTTYEPAYAGAAVVAVRSKGDTEVSEATAAEAPTAEAPPPSQAASPAYDITSLGDTLKQAISEGMNARSESSELAITKVLERLESLEEQSRSAFQVPDKGAPSHPDDFGRGDWVSLVLRTLTGENVSQNELQARTVADLVTSDNIGVVPPVYSKEMIGIIDKGRPFLESTRQLTKPVHGVSLTVPVITTRPTTGIQANEKDELASTTTSITTTSFGITTIGGYGDISIQLLKRSDPSYLQLYLDLLAEQYAVDADDKAVDVLIAAGMSQGGSFDPDDGPKFGESWANAAAVSRQLRPDTIWMGSDAVQQFIDATNPDTGSPLYGNLAAAFSAADGPGGTVSGLRPVYVPALDDEDADIIVGPSRGFGWAEDGTYTLEVDVPARAGRDVGLVGMLWFAPLYPTAFTRYWLES